jgi:serine O-acetyltransferase
VPVSSSPITLLVSRKPASPTDSLLEQLCTARRAYRLPLRLRVLAEQFAHDVLALLFPHFSREPRADTRELDEELDRLRATLVEVLAIPVEGGADETATDRTPDALAARFLDRLEPIYESLVGDARAICEGDPAATSVDEVILAYPGFLAIACYRIAHEFYRMGVPVFPRLLTEYAHRATGIDIHPGATIGQALAIDHGTGVVIGETAVIGDRVKIYQGVTLGALSVDKSLASTKRHPTIGNDVVIYANATILGGATVIGDGSIIGGNVWLTHGVPPRSVVTHTPAVERRKGDEDLLEFNI